MASNGDDQPSDTMRERVGGSRVKLWVLLDANRWAVAGLVLAGLLVSLVVIGVLDPSPLQQQIAVSDPVETIFQGYLTAIITGVTLVVTINQLVLSQELGPLGDQRERMDGAMAFRRDVEAVLDADTAPPEPSSFLAAIIDAVQSKANALGDAVNDARDETLRERVNEYVDSLTGNATQVGNRLEDAEFGTFEVVFAALDFNYSWKIYEARRLRNTHADSLTDEAREAFDDVVEVLTFFGPAREHFKTLYFQWELINLSRAILYSALPALVVTLSMMGYYDAQTVPGATFGISNDILVVSLAATVSTTPFIILLSYVLRIATVAKRTLAIGPFILRDTARSDDIDWE